MIFEARDQTSLFGHEKEAAAFMGAWHAGRFPHAWLITGQSGIGKATFAYHAARWVLANDRRADTLELPKNHQVVRQVSTGACPGLLVIEPEDNDKTGAQYTISVTQIRGGHDKRTDVRYKGIYEFFQHTAADDSWRVVLIDQAELLNEHAQNAVLKILEEPPPRGMLILVASQPGRLLPTIRSRCRSLPLQPLTPQQLRQAAAQSGLQVPTNAEAALIAAKGSVGELARLLTLDVEKIDSALIPLLADLPQVDWKQLHDLAAMVAKKDSEPQFTLLLDLLADRLQARFTTRPAESRGWDEVIRKVHAIKGAHLDRTASLIEIFQLLQRITAVAARVM